MGWDSGVRRFKMELFFDCDLNSPQFDLRAALLQQQSEALRRAGLSDLHFNTDEIERLTAAVQADRASIRDIMVGMEGARVCVRVWGGGGEGVCVCVTWLLAGVLWVQTWVCQGVLAGTGQCFAVQMGLVPSNPLPPPHCHTRHTCIRTGPHKRTHPRARAPAHTHTHTHTCAGLFRGAPAAESVNGRGGEEGAVGRWRASRRERGQGGAVPGSG